MRRPPLTEIEDKDRNQPRDCEPSNGSRVERSPRNAPNSSKTMASPASTISGIVAGEIFWKSKMRHFAAPYRRLA